MAQRNYAIDFLRTFGVLLTILAHVGAPETVNNLRTFDVVLLVVLSGMCSTKCDSIDSISKYLSYIWKRIKRLVLPTYIMLLIMFPTLYIAYTIVFHREFFWTAQQMINSFLLLNEGIGYVWIVRVYLLVALVSPILARIAKKTSEVKFWGIFAGCLAVNGCMYIISCSLGEGWKANEFLQNIVFYILPYSLAAMYGMRLSIKKQHSRRYAWIMIGAFILVQIAYALKNYGFAPSSFKYPPSTYYLLYGLMVSSIALALTDKIRWKESRCTRLIQWGSTNSFNVYLAHVPVLIVINSFSGHVLKLPWYATFIVVVACSVAMIWILNKIIAKLGSMLRKRGRNEG